MGEMAQKIAGVNVKDLLEILNQAYAEEWLAYYQYWIGAEVAVGMLRPSVVHEFHEHAEQELKHASMLAERILQLGGTPLLNPDDWSKYAHCKYDAPQKPDTKTLVTQNLASERCAINRYQEICNMCFGKDHQTFHIARHILKEELEHEQEMEDFLADFAIAAK